MEKKITKKEMFAMIMEEVKGNAEMVAFLEHEIELLDKKKSNGKAKVNETMNSHIEIVYNRLASVGRTTVSELIAKGGMDELANESGVVSTAKITAYLTKLIASGRVERVVEKKKAYYSIKD
jgi:hypothetical protein